MSDHISQATDILLMVRPSQFGFNAETAGTNIFQQESSTMDLQDIHGKALNEFDEFVKILRDHKIYVIVFQESLNSGTPDALFPNNWITFHKNSIIIYPMLAINRRKERRKDWINFLKKIFSVKEIFDLSAHENQDQFLEGTGSMVLDRKNKIVYANLSSRTNENILREVAAKLNYEPVSFKAVNADGREIYHTNVMMAIGEKTAVICPESIPDKEERKNVLEKLSAAHEIVEINYDQLLQFAGNMLMVKNREGKKFWVMSDQAFASLTSSQAHILKGDADFISVDLKTIEAVGGGSARCMMAEIY